jgi:hypothetical protein
MRDNNRETGMSMSDLHNNDEPDAEQYNDKVHQEAAKRAFLEDGADDPDNDEEKAMIRRMLTGRYDNIPEEMMPSSDDEVDDKWDKFKM